MQVRYYILSSSHRKMQINSFVQFNTSLHFVELNVINIYIIRFLMLLNYLIFLAKVTKS